MSFGITSVSVSDSNTKSRSSCGYKTTQQRPGPILRVTRSSNVSPVSWGSPGISWCPCSWWWFHCAPPQTLEGGWLRGKGRGGGGVGKGMRGRGKGGECYTTWHQPTSSPLFSSDRWGWLLTSFGTPWVAQRVWAIPTCVVNSSSKFKSWTAETFPKQTITTELLYMYTHTWASHKPHLVAQATAGVRNLDWTTGLKCLTWLHCGICRNWSWLAALVGIVLCIMYQCLMYGCPSSMA